MLVLIATLKLNSADLLDVAV